MNEDRDDKSEDDEILVELMKKQAELFSIVSTSLLTYTV